MARTSTVSAEQVAAAANTQLAQGTPPTARSVREQLGTGSMATILRHFQAWQATQSKPAPVVTTLPRELERILLDFTAREIAVSKGALESDLAASQQANGDLIAESERQAVTIDELNSTLQEQAAEIANATGKLEQLAVDLKRAHAEAQTEREAAEHARTELAKALLRLESMPRLEADLVACRDSETKERTGRVQAEQRAAVAEAKYEGEAKARAKAEEMHQSVAAQLLQATGELGDAKVAIRTSVAQLEDRAREIQSQHQTIESLRASLSGAEKESAQLKGQMTQIAPVVKGGK